MSTRVIVMVVLLAGCGGNGIEIAREVRADSTSPSVTLTPPIQALAGPRVLCLEFQPPGRSHRAADLTFVALSMHAGQPLPIYRVVWRSPRTGGSTGVRPIGYHPAPPVKGSFM